MKKLIKLTLITFFAILFHFPAFSQEEEEEAAVFYSNKVDSFAVYNFDVVVNYYTIDSNINDGEANYFVTYNPTKADYLNYALTKPSYVISFKKDERLKYILIHAPSKEDEEESIYILANLVSGKSSAFPSSVKGSMSEHRANELLESKLDSAAKMGALVGKNEHQLLFDGTVYSYQPYEELHEELVAITRELIVAGVESQDELKGYIKSETVDGIFDFTKFVENQEEEWFEFGGFTYDADGFVKFLWGHKVKKLGLAKSKDAVALWEDIYSIELSKNDAKAIKNGFKANLDD